MDYKNNNNNEFGQNGDHQSTIEKINKVNFMNLK
jgi:hypothetical protein